MPRCRSSSRPSAQRGEYRSCAVKSIAQCIGTPCLAEHLITQLAPHSTGAIWPLLTAAAVRCSAGISVLATQRGDTLPPHRRLVLQRLQRHLDHLPVTEDTAGRGRGEHRQAIPTVRGREL